ncbi:hypothetical protein Daesc_009304 [Daldinia eschscholtzii]|uniref:Uncharacterized protein n=1 Tax=Daldinia eschscholtzii TaxID=292717 RepID=A0AAX6M9A2_9PEZI
METVYPAVTSNGVVTSFVPLATSFTPSSECSGYFRLNGPSLVAFDPGYGLDIDDSVRCVPSAVTTWWEQGRLGTNDDGHTALSLGPLICPYEWQTVATSIKDKSSTLAMCCPSGYYLENGIPGSVGGDCLSDVSSGMRLTYASTSTGNSDIWSTETTSLTEGSTVGAIAIVGWNIKLARPTMDASSKPATSSSDSTSTSESISTPSPSANSPSASPPPSSSSSSSNSSSHISPGVAAGIGVGVGLGVVGATALIVTLCLMRRRKRKTLTEPPQVYQHSHGAIFSQPPPHELHEGAPTKHELHDPQTGRHELQGGYQNVGRYQGPPLLAELHE